MVYTNEKLTQKNGVKMAWKKTTPFKTVDFTGFEDHKIFHCPSYYVYQNTPYEWNKISEK